MKKKKKGSQKDSFLPASRFLNETWSIPKCKSW